VKWVVQLACALLLLAGAGGAESAGAQAPAVQIWYRSAPGCPDVAAFIARLAALGRPGQAASAGDRVDFVVTLGPAPASGLAQPGSVGRLERQTERGTVAIRELRAARCEDVAEALALSLELALQPVADNPPEQLAPSAPTVQNGAESLPNVGAPMPASPPAAPEEEPSATPSSLAPAPSRSHLGLRLGVQGTLATGIAPSAMPGVAVFVELGGVTASPSARLSLRGGYRESEAPGTGTDLQVVLLAGRLEGCPWTWVSGVFSLEPCAGLDLGVLRAESPGPQGRSDSGVWLSGAAHGRAAWRIAPALLLEVELGALVPFVRYDLGADMTTASLFQTAPVGVAAALGAAWLLP
jgi:hypothetical protein